MSEQRLRTLRALIVREKRWLESDPSDDRHDNINALEWAAWLAAMDKVQHPSCYEPDAGAKP